MRILEETPRLKIKAKVKLKGQNLGKPREYMAQVQSKVESKDNSQGQHEGYIIKGKKIHT